MARRSALGAAGGGKLAARLAGAGRTARTALGRLLAPRALGEIALFLAILVLVDELYFGGTRFFSLHPNPFWLIVLLVAVQYGTNEALVAAAGASLALFTGDLPGQDFNETYLSYLFSLARLPLLWVMVAVVVGELARRHRQRRAEAEANAEAERRRADEVSQAYEKAQSALDRLEDHVAAGVTSSVAVLAMSAQLDPRSPGQALMQAMSAVSRLLGPDKVSLAFLHDGVLQIVLQEGWAADDAYSTEFGPDSSLFQAIVGEQRRVVVTEADDEPILGDEGVLAVPVRDAARDRVTGMLKVEAIDFARLTFSKVEMAAPLGDWVGSAYAQALRHYRSQGSAMLATDLPVNSRAFLERQSAVLAAIARRAGFPVTLVYLALQRSAAELTPAALAQAVAGAAQRRLRDTDLAFEERGAQGRFVVMLPLADTAGATVTRDRLLADLAEQFNSAVDQLPLATRVEVLAAPDAAAEMESGHAG